MVERRRRDCRTTKERWSVDHDASWTGCATPLARFHQAEAGIVAGARLWRTCDMGLWRRWHRVGLIANSGRAGTEWHWRVGQQNGSFRSWNGDLVCTNFWIYTGANGNLTYRKFGGTNCVTT
jgi:hypothetical protein